jgi:hypothetical protein
MSKELIERFIEASDCEMVLGEKMPPDLAAFFTAWGGATPKGLVEILRALCLAVRDREADEDHRDQHQREKAFPAGTHVTCPFCEKVLYQLVRDVPAGPDDVLPAGAVVRISAIRDPISGALILCPDHGAIRPNFITPGSAS